MRRLFVFLALFACALGPIGPSRAAAPPEYGGRLVRAHAGEVTTLDPQSARTLEEIEIVRQLYGRLTRIAADGSVEMDLAQSMEVSDDGLRYRFRIAPRARFHNGDPVTAADVRYSIERLAGGSGRVRGGWILSPVVGSNVRWDGPFPAIEGIRLRGLDAIEFQLSRPVPLFSRMLARVEASIVERQFRREGDPAPGNELVGSGAFMPQAAYDGSGRVELRGSPYHVRGKPYVASLTYTPIKDTRSRLLSVTYRGADVASFPLSELDPTGLDTGSIKVVDAPGSWLTMVAIGDGPGAATRPRVRDLLRAGIDIRSIVQVILNGRGSPAFRYLEDEGVRLSTGGAGGGDARGAEGAEGADGSAAAISIARELSIAERLGREPVLTYPTFQPDLTIVAERIQVNLARNGLHVKLQSAGRDAYEAALDSKQFDFLLARVESSPDVCDFLSFFADWIGALPADAMAGAGDPHAGGDVVRDLERRMEDSGKVFFLYREPKTFLVKASVHGLAFDGSGNPVFEGCRAAP